MFRGKNLFILHNKSKTHQFFCERKKNPEKKPKKQKLTFFTYERKKER